MATFRCRVTLPKESGWSEIEADTPEEAANSYHCRDLHALPGATYIDLDGEGKRRQIVIFARVEVEGHGSWVSRMYKSGIYRKGGVQVRPNPTLEAIAKAVGYESDPKTLLDPWDFEEKEWK